MKKMLGINIIKQVCFFVFFLVLFSGVFCLRASADIGYDYDFKTATFNDMDDAIHFINGTGQYTCPVREFKICYLQLNTIPEDYGVLPHFFCCPLQLFSLSIAYRAGSPESTPPGGPTGQWSIKKCTDPLDVLNFLNGKGVYQYPVRKDAKISAVWNCSSNHYEFYIFYSPYQPEDETNTPPPWYFQKFDTPSEVINFLNGVTSPSWERAGRAEICAANGECTDRMFFVFYQSRTKSQPRGGWRFESGTQLEEVTNLLNKARNGTDVPYPIAHRDNKSVTGYKEDDGTRRYFVFKPQGFLVIPRSIFWNNPLVDYFEWKYVNGFDCYGVTAEWLQEYGEGEDIRLKIRNCIRDYYETEKVNYVVLVGDSVVPPRPEDQEFENLPEGVFYEPPPTDLSENDWIMPCGYYLVTAYDSEGTIFDRRPQFTTLFWSDLTDKIVYGKYESDWRGEYPIYVGIMPVRTTLELENVIRKTIEAEPTNKYTFLSSENYATPSGMENMSQSLQLAAGPFDSVDIKYFYQTTPEEDIYHAFFETDGIISASGHGILSGFNLIIFISTDDSDKFQQINPLMILNACHIMSYMDGECLMEAFLKAPKGPAVVSIPPIHSFVDLDPTHYFNLDIFSRKTIGQAFYDHALGAYQNPDHLFGDPSLVPVAPPVLYYYFIQAGQSVTLSNLYDLGIDISFSEIKSAGSVNARKIYLENQLAIPPYPYPYPYPAPPHFRSPSYYYEVETTATYEGPIDIRFTYDEAKLQGLCPSCDESELRIFHKELDGTWVDVTTSQDMALNTISGRVTHLAEFLLAFTFKRGDINRDGVVDTKDFETFLAAYCSFSPAPAFNPLADFDGDNCITINDYRIFRSLI